LTDFRGDLSRVDVPALVVHGDDDRIVPLAASGQRTHALLQGSQMVVVEGAPHGLNWTHAEELNSALVDFIR
jgi:pimeloyl-ACP methyl ester carboxylesterase